MSDDSVLQVLELARGMDRASAQAGTDPRTQRIEPPYEAAVTDTELRGVTEQLFRDGHYSQAIEEGFKYLNNLVKKRTRLGADGAGLMTAAFSPGAPRLRIASLTTRSGRDRQQGYMRMLEGAMLGIRNPRAHEHKHEEAVDDALGLLAFCNHLVRIVKAAKRQKNRSASGNQA